MMSPGTAPDQRMASAISLYQEFIGDDTWNIDIEAMWHYRLQRVRSMLGEGGYVCAVLYDPVNIRYATGASTMPVFSLHFRDRYCVITENGPVIFFEKPHWRHLTEGSGLVDEVRDRVSCRGATGGAIVDQNIATWIDDLGEILGKFGGGNRRIAMDHCEPGLLRALEAVGYTVCDVQEPLERARSIKSDEEIECMCVSLHVTETGMTEMQNTLEPGVTENQLWAILGQNNLAYGGEWLECRLLSSGQRTNPWLQEASDRVIEAGDLVAFDTDIIGPFGYCADISRTLFCGPGTPSSRQKLLYSLAQEEIAHNTSLLKPGATLREIASGAFKVPDKYRVNSYAFVAHGVGLCDEWPNCYQLDRLEAQGEGDIVLEPGMTLCVESYMGESNGPDGVKLEEQVLITDAGQKTLSTFPWDEKLTC